MLNKKLDMNKRYDARSGLRNMTKNKRRGERKGKGKNKDRRKTVPMKKGIMRKNNGIKPEMTGPQSMASGEEGRPIKAQASMRMTR